jgi:hypothetical protein
MHEYGKAGYSVGQCGGEPLRLDVLRLPSESITCLFPMPCPLAFIIATYSFSTG